MPFIVRVVVLAIAIPYLAWYGIQSFRSERNWKAFAPREHAIFRWILYILTAVLAVVAVTSIASLVSSE